MWNRQSKGNHACSSGNLPMDKLDELILKQFAERICQSERLNQMIGELRKRTKNTKEAEQQKINEITRLLQKVEKAQRNLIAAIEEGFPNDDTMKKRAQELKAQRESLLIELASARRHHAVPLERILPSDIDAFQPRHQNQAEAQGFRQALSATLG